ncbi:acyl-CoA dehydrogenase family protein [Streptomyces pini]|uniref:Acyl-CoA dehydrogenase n=1 Tax=Streptomyces pini TaxID=1520580 RepID=A0A1I4FLV2_9ACTN|nr:acyl-CoA dehydrogenase family protein [Streptomyces pini]SFL17887.1 Acyl-CoA dehydrogenase [Streptomyces pini]
MVFPHSPGELGAEPTPDEQVREFADRVARPTTADRDRARRWDPALFAELAGARTGPGLAGPLVPRHLGGGGLSAVRTCALLQGLGEGARDPGLALATAVHAVLATVPLRVFGTARQQQRYLPRMASGQWRGALSLHQTQGAALAPAVTVRSAADGRVLNGELELVAGAPEAHHFLIVADELGGGGRTAFVVDRATAGVRVTQTRPEAMRTCSWGRLTLDDCHVPDDAVLGTPRGAATEVEPLLAALNWVFCSAPWLGVMRALTRDAVDHAREHRLFGRPLSHAQSARLTLADMATRCELAAVLLHRAAEQFDSGGRPSQRDAASARLFTARAARTVIEGAAGLAPAGVLTGGDGLIERAHRDALFLATAGGGDEVLRPVIAASELELG